MRERERARGPHQGRTQPPGGAGGWGGASSTTSSTPLPLRPLRKYSPAAESVTSQLDVESLRCFPHRLCGGFPPPFLVHVLICRCGEPNQQKCMLKYGPGVLPGGECSQSAVLAQTRKKTAELRRECRYARSRSVTWTQSFWSAKKTKIVAKRDQETNSWKESVTLLPPQFKRRKSKLL